jgi:hypothetical protein
MSSNGAAQQAMAMKATGLRQPVACETCVGSGSGRALSRLSSDGKASAHLNAVPTSVHNAWFFV